MRIILRFLAWFGVPLGVGLEALSIMTLNGVWLWIGAISGILLAILGALIKSWYSRTNKARVSAALDIESWDVTNDRWHNSNTDLIYWNGAFYLVHAASPFHFASQQCHLVVLRSQDAHEWQKLAEIYAPGEDIRDPKFAPIADRLFLYALVNRSIDPEPYTTVVTSSVDGLEWSPLEKIDPQGWLFWRPKTNNGKDWYVPAYWWEHGKSILLESNDGIHWNTLSTIHEGGRNDETDIEFLPDGSLICTARLEYSFNIFGDRRGSTLIAETKPPFDRWNKSAESTLTRLDGPCMFPYHGRIYSVGRYQPEVTSPFLQQGGVFSRKRTSLFEVRKDELVYLSDIPSAGDTSYAGVAILENDVYICYYTSPIHLDYPWLVGMLEPTPIRMAKVNLEKLEKLANLLPIS